MGENVLIVVARFREEISWVGQTGLPTVVYDKSGRRGPYHSLPNIGREAHTYLYHILKNYPRFPTYTFFSQGDPFPHFSSGTTPELLAKTIRELVFRNICFKGLASYSIRCDRMGRPHELALGGKSGVWAGASHDIPVGEVYKHLFQGPVPTSFHTRAPAGLFLVHKDRILARPREFYARAMNLVLADPGDEWNTGHAFERLWAIIFNGYTKLNKKTYRFRFESDPVWVSSGFDERQTNDVKGSNDGRE
ncbi:MAG: DUF3431 domain-containing protein [Deltaproteobacteria bacterium]|nr:DUF3431 domain-containing protein [Deltaproteobacteria bacterium]